ncbi:MAG: diacylglycerol kinase family lipid kinase [Actinobacteria bacterium]|nr:diacylglycerol kinase family lipid kinase [Actinomycetota bacterium]
MIVPDKVADEIRRVAVVFNPATGGKRATQRKRETKAALEQAQVEVLWCETTEEDSGEGHARRAVQEGAELVFVSGGDGTIRACASALAGTDIPLALLPAGTGNLLAVNFGVPLGLGDAIEVGLRGARARIDVGDSSSGKFVIMAGMGFDAAMLRDANPKLKSRFGALAYVLSALKHLRAPAAVYRVALDGKTPIERAAQCVLIANLGRLQGGIVALPDAEPDDGCFDVAIIKTGSVSRWLQVAWRLLRGRRDDDPRVETFLVRGVEVEVDRPVPVEFDGEVVPDARSFSARVQPSSLTLCVPAPSMEDERRAQPRERGNAKTPNWIPYSKKADRRLT